MLGMGLTLTHHDMLNLRHSGRLLVVGVVLQYLVMPLGAWLIAMALGFAVLVLAAVELYNGIGWQEIFMVSVALAVSAIPEGPPGGCR